MRYLTVILALFFFSTEISHAQKDLYLSLHAGLGHTFVKVDNSEFAKPSFSPSFDLGSMIRYDFTERFSGSLGMSGIDHKYNIIYTRTVDTLKSDIYAEEDEWYLTIPAELTKLFRIKKEKHIYLTVQCGIAFGIKIGNRVNSNITGFTNQLGDSLVGSLFHEQETNPVSFNISAGAGLEKQLKNLSRIGFNLSIRFGILKTFEGKGELVYYENPIALPEPPIYNIPYAQPTETSNFFSRNTSLFITIYYAIPFERRKFKKEEKLGQE